MPDGPPLTKIGTSPDSLRFSPGDNVIVNMNGTGMLGVVVDVLCRADGMPEGYCAAFVVRLMDGRIVMPPIDHPNCLMPAPDGAPKSPGTGPKAGEPNLMRIGHKSAEDMRFKVDDRVMCNMGPKGWLPGVVHGVKVRQDGMPDGYCTAYKVQLWISDTEGGPRKFVQAPHDVDQIIQAAPPLMMRNADPETLRFSVGDEVLCNVNNEWAKGVVEVVMPWDAVRMPPDMCGAYSVKRADGKGVIMAPVDHPQLVRRIIPPEEMVPKEGE